MTQQLHAASISPFAATMLSGCTHSGTALGSGYILIEDRVLAITPPGALRMPNGIETELPLVAGEHVEIGGGALRTATATIVPGPLWDPRPRPRIQLRLLPHPQLHLTSLVGRGPGLTPLGDDVLVGYLAGSALAGASAIVTRSLAETYGRQTTALSRTLLALAAEGQLPEAAHRLLVNGDFQPLLAFGATSGRGIAVGLGLAGGTSTEGRPRVISLTLPLQQPAWRFRIVVTDPKDAPCL